MQNVGLNDGPTGQERRRDFRFPAVGIHLLYSPAEEQTIDNLADVLLHASAVDMSLSGLCFDVSETIKLGDQLVVLVHGSNNEVSEQLITEVCWLQELGDKHFRVGTHILHSIPLPKGDSDALPGTVHNIQQGEVFPSGLDLICPACQQQSQFILIGVQKIEFMKSVGLPLYDCKQCGTTRSITSLLAHARQSLAVNK